MSSSFSAERVHCRAQICDYDKWHSKENELALLSEHLQQLSVLTAVDEIPPRQEELERLFHRASCGLHQC